MNDFVVRKVRMISTWKNMLRIVVEELVVGLVHYQPSVLRFAQLNDTLHFSARVNIPGGIVW